MAIQLKKLLKKSSVARNMGSSITIVSICFRILKQHFPSADLSEIDGYIRHNILFIKNLPRNINILLYKEKQTILDTINKELSASDFRYILKDVMTK